MGGLGKACEREKQRKTWGWGHDRPQIAWGMSLMGWDTVVWVT